MTTSTSEHSPPPADRSGRRSRLRARTEALRRGWRRGVLGHRRALSALLVAAAVLLGWRALAPPAPETVPVLVAAHDLPAGTPLAEADLATVELPPEAVPAGIVEQAQAVGRTTTGPVRRGEPVTDARLVAPSLLDGYPGRVAVPVRIPDAGVVALLRVGDRIDLVATDPRSGSTEVVGADLPVLALPREDDEMTRSAGRGRLIVVGATSDSSEKVASAAATFYLIPTISR